MGIKEMVGLSKTDRNRRGSILQLTGYGRYRSVNVKERCLGNKFEHREHTDDTQNHLSTYS